MTKFGLYTSFYNSETFIENCFKNVESLKYDNFFWHITDDFSEDNTKNLLLERIHKSPIKDKITYYPQQYKKQMYWLPNEFFDESFDWIVQLDSDDYIHPNSLSIYDYFIRKFPNDLSVITCDAFKKNYKEQSLHSILYVLNDKPITDKLKRYHPEVDYLNNISYSLFGNLRAFKNNVNFEIDDNLACAEDSYRIFWCNSQGKYLHIPRPLYTWFLREDSESHGEAPENFNGNFDIAYNKLSGNDQGVNKYFNDVYKETCALGSFDLDSFKLSSINLMTRELTNHQKQKIKELYPDFQITFNQRNKELNLYCLNYISSKTLKELNKEKINLFYKQVDNHFSSNQHKDNYINNELDYYKNQLKTLLPNNFSWWSYLRHFKITSIPEPPKKTNEINLYENILDENLDENQIHYDFTDGVKVFVSGKHKKDYIFEFIDREKNEVVFLTEKTKPQNETLWVSPIHKFYVNWEINIYCQITKKKISNFNLNLWGKDVMIEFMSSSLGDTIAWIPYVEEFRKKHNCYIFCKTFHNKLFEKAYPNIKFITETNHQSFYCKYKLGWFYRNNHYNEELHKEDPKKLPLQKTASQILGIPYQEIKPEISSLRGKTLNKEKYFTFSMHSTAQSKYWNYPEGWKIIVDYLNNMGYEAVNVDLHDTFGGGGWMNKVPDNCFNLKKPTLEDTISVMKGAEFHMGLSSGLSWLAWGLNKHVILISGFSNPITEFTTNITRIFSPKHKCNSCFNRHNFNPNDWAWCPEHKGTPRQFECTTSITPQQVLSEIKKLIHYD